MPTKEQLAQYGAELLRRENGGVTAPILPAYLAQVPQQETAPQEAAAAAPSLLEKRLAQADANVDSRKDYLTKLREDNKSIRQALLTKSLPQENKVGEERLARLGKTQAITDFLAALTSGIIGLEGKNYSPAIPNTAGQYAVDLSNLRKVNEARKEKADQLRLSLEMQDLQDAEKLAYADYATAQEQLNALIKHIAELEEKGVDFSNKWKLQKDKQTFDAEENAKKIEASAKEAKERNEATIKAANIRAKASAENANKNKKENIIEFGDFAIKGAEDKSLIGLYHYLVEQSGIKGVTTLEGDGEFKEEVIKDTPTDSEMKSWIRKNRKQILPLLKKWADTRGYTIEMEEEEQGGKNKEIHLGFVPVAKYPTIQSYVQQEE